MNWFDRLLSRFSIRIKVLVLVLPFVLSISAVGLVGILASGYLQDRMTMAASATTSLRGFKDVYAAMIAFLEKADDQSRADVATKLDAQRTVLDAARQRITDAEDGRSQLDSAYQALSSVRSRMDALWAIHLREQGLETSLQDAANTITASQAALQEAAAGYEKSVRSAEGDAREHLRDANKILAATGLVATIKTGFEHRASDQDGLKALVAAMDELKMRQKLMTVALPKDAKSAGKAFATQLKTLKTALGKASANDLSTVTTGLAALSALTDPLDRAATDRMKDVAATFAELDGQLAKADLVMQDTRHLVEAAYLARIAFSSFMLDRSEAKRAALAEQVDLCRKAMFALDATAGDLGFSKQQSQKLIPALALIDKDSAQLVSTSAERRTHFADAAENIDAVGRSLSGFADVQKTAAARQGATANSLSFGAGAVGVLIAILSGLALVHTLRGPIARITLAMRKVADGALDTEIEARDRGDEIGEMARALDVFKSNAQMKRVLEIQSAEDGLRAEAQRQAHEADKLRRDAEIAEAVNALAAGLEALAKGRLNIMLDRPFAAELDPLRMDFNTAVTGLRGALLEIRASSHQVQENSRQMTDGAKALAVRTEQQAASLEETAAAVDEIHATIRSAADQAALADRSVRRVQPDRRQRHQGHGADPADIGQDLHHH